MRVLHLIYIIWCMLAFISLMLIVLPFILILSLFMEGKSFQRTCFYLLRFWAWTFCLLSGFPHRVINQQLAKDKAYIFICNHNSYLDAVSIVRVIPQAFKPLGKIEMAKIPVFGIIYRNLVVMLDRSSKESRAASVEQLKEDLAGGQSILIFPEGTVNRTGEPLAEFYDGAFRIAIETQTPVLPVVFLNTKNLLPRTEFFKARPGWVTAIFLPEIPVDRLTQEDLPALKQTAFDKMYEVVSKA